MENRTGAFTILVPLLILGLCPVVSALAQESAGEPKVELLWPGGAPGALGSEDVDKPSLAIYLPPADKAVGMGVVVCPGGGYHSLAWDHEGQQIARWLNSRGIAAFVLKCSPPGRIGWRTG